MKRLLSLLISLTILFTGNLYSQSEEAQEAQHDVLLHLVREFIHVYQKLRHVLRVLLILTQVSN